MNKYVIVKNSLNNKFLNEIIPDFKNLLIKTQVLSSAATDNDVFKYLSFLNHGIHFEVNVSGDGKFYSSPINDYGYVTMTGYFSEDEIKNYPLDDLDLYRRTITIYSYQRQNYPNVQWTEEEERQGYKIYTQYCLSIPLAPGTVEGRNLFLYNPITITEDPPYYYSVLKVIADFSPDNISNNIKFLINYINLGGKVYIHFRNYSNYYENYPDLYVFHSISAYQDFYKYGGVDAHISGILKSTKSDNFRYLSFCI